MMTPISHPADAYRGYRFPSAVIAHAVWLYLRLPLSHRDVEETLAERGIQVSYESVRCWVAKFGPQFAAQLRKREARPGRVWHLDEMAVRIAGKQHWLWRAVDEHGATLDVLLQEQRDTDAAERFFRVLLGHAGPQRIDTDKLGSYAAALRRLPELADGDYQQVRSAMRCNNRAEQAHQPTRVRERPMGRFRCPSSARALPGCVHPYVEPVPSASPRLHRSRVPGRAPGALRGVERRGRVAPVIRPGEGHAASGTPFTSARLLRLTQPASQSVARRRAPFDERRVRRWASPQRITCQTRSSQLRFARGRIPASQPPEVDLGGGGHLRAEDALHLLKCALVFLC